MNNRLTLAVLPRTVRGQPLSLAGSPDGKSFLYTHGNSVVIRSFDSPQYSDVYTQHSCEVLCARYSPSGFYIASADKSGKVRIWDTVNAEHILKNEYQPISGPIKDLAWSPDNQRMVCVGEGREKFGHVFLADTGTSNGDITGQSRPINSCDFRPARPFRIITGSEDNTAAYYEGPPFKFKGTKNDHGRYCQAVRYSPDGAFWASAGFDGKLFLYEGKDSELVAEVTDGKAAHAGGIYGLSWSPDGKHLLSASGDKTCKVWDIETRKVVRTFDMGSEVSDQQLACLWNSGSGDKLISVSLSGNINFLDNRTGGSGLEMVVRGHNKPITALSKVDSKTVYTGDSEGRLVRWNTEDGRADEVRGKGHAGAQINSLKWAGDHLVTAGIDDTVRRVEGDAYTDFAAKLQSQPRGAAHGGDVSFVATVDAVVAFRGGQEVCNESVKYEPTCVAARNEGGHVVVGDNDKNVHVYRFGGNGFEEVKTLNLLGQITCLSYSPDGAHLAVGDSNRRVTVFTVGEEGEGAGYAKTHAREWGFHTARVSCLAWAPGGRLLASGGLDCTVILWSMDAPTKHSALTSAHVQSQINGLKWMDDQTLASVGQDGNTKIWNVTWKPE